MIGGNVYCARKRMEIFGVLPRGTSSSLVGWEQSPIDGSRPRLPKRQEAPLISTQRVDFEYLPNHCLSPPDPRPVPIPPRLVTHKSITSDAANPRYSARQILNTRSPANCHHISVVRESVFNKIWIFNEASRIFIHQGFVRLSWIIKFFCPPSRGWLLTGRGFVWPELCHPAPAHPARSNQIHLFAP